MKSQLTLILASCFYLLSCNSSRPEDLSNGIPAPVKEEVVRKLTPEELREQLKQKECDQATTYLDGTMKYTPIYKGLLSTKVIGINLICSIRSSATIATFKNMVAHVTFVSKTDAVVIEKDIDIYEFILPGGSIKYMGEIDCTNQEWKDIAEVKWQFKSAECE